MCPQLKNLYPSRKISPLLLLRTQDKRSHNGRGKGHETDHFVPTRGKDSEQMEGHVLQTLAGALKMTFRKRSGLLAVAAPPAAQGCILCLFALTSERVQRERGEGERN